MILKYSTTGRKKTKEEIIDSYYSQFKVKCKCGHVVVISPINTKKLCSFCGNYIYRDKKDEFKERMKEKLNG